MWETFQNPCITPRVPSLWHLISLDFSISPVGASSCMLAACSLNGRISSWLWLLMEEATCRQLRRQTTLSSSRGRMADGAVNLHAVPSHSLYVQGARSVYLASVAMYWHQEQEGWRWASWWRWRLLRGRQSTRTQRSWNASGWLEGKWMANQRRWGKWGDWEGTWVQAGSEYSAFRRLHSWLAVFPSLGPYDSPPFPHFQASFVFSSQLLTFMMNCNPMQFSKGFIFIYTFSVINKHTQDKIQDRNGHPVTQRPPLYSLPAPLQRNHC